MKQALILIFVMALIAGCKNNEDLDINLKYDENLSLEYDQVIDAYQQLARHYPQAKFIEMGKTDIGKPLHLFMISKNKDFDPASIKRKGKCIIMIINGIHPGEPEGTDASIQFAWDILRNKDEMQKYLDNSVIAIIPVYNIGGALDRSRYYRMNQDGPIYKGRRRNAKNMDLNRDFAKQETKNAQTFAKTFTYLNPDVFIDTHTTNGSDHQYTITLIATMHNKLDREMGLFFKEKMLPDLYKGMTDNSEYDMIPYVMTFNRGDIKSGLITYNDLPLYSTGYTSLFNCYSFMTENLVYKYFPDRVRSVVDFFTQVIDFTSNNAAEIRALKEKADEAVKSQEIFPIEWKLDDSQNEYLVFNGYEYSYIETPITGRRKGFYDHDKPWTDTIPYYTTYKPVTTVARPYAYIIPQAWEEIALKLMNNGVIAYQLKEDAMLEVESYYIDDVTRSQRATQGHYLNNSIKVHKTVQAIQYYKGDYIIKVNQHSNRFIVEMLEPHAPSSYFAWNFFDSILEAHDFYSVWGFESHFLELLDQDENLRTEFDQKKMDDHDFANDPVAQLQYLYQKAPVSEIEKWNRLYPVSRLAKEIELSLY